MTYIPKLSLTLDGATRTIPIDQHVQFITAHGKKFSVINSGKLTIYGSLTIIDLGD